MKRFGAPLPTTTRQERKLGTFYFLFQVFLLSSLLNWGNSLLIHPISQGMLNFVYFSINALAVVLIFRRFLRKNILRTARDYPQVLLYAAAGFGLYWLVSTLVTALTVQAFPDYVNLNDSYLLTLIESDPVFMIIGSVVLAPIAEEVIHRGLIFGTFRSRMPIWLAYALSALIFAAIHVLSYIGTYPAGYLALALVQYLPAGLILAWAYQRSGVITTPILIHILNNALAVLTLR